MSSTFLNIVHELEPKKNEYLGPGCLLSRKVWWTSKSRGFLQTGMDHMNMSFEYFQIEKWMLKTARAEKVDEKKWSHLFSLHAPFLTYGPEIVLKKWAFCSLMLNSARHLNVLKQFTDIHPKDLVTHFQKYVLFIMLWHTVLQISKVWTNFIKLLLSQHTFWYFNCQYFINCGSAPFKTYHFLKECNETFQIHIYKLLQQTQVSCWEQHKIATWQGNMEARQMTSFFLSTFSTVTVFNIYFCI